MSMRPPVLHLPRQLIMSPGAQYQLQPRSSILASSQVQYRLGGLVTWHGVQTRSVSKELVRPVTVTSTGLIHSLPSSDSSATERRYSIEILSSPTEYAVDINSSSMMQSSVIQLLSIEVIVKRPRFLLVTPFSDDYIRASGLPVGGPYLMGVSYHDELGRPFDAVADDYLRLKFHLHRTDFVEVQPIYTFGSSDLIHSNLGRQHHSSLLYFMVLPLTSRFGSSSGIRPHALLRLLPLEHPTDFAPTYLSVIHGGELDILPSSLLTVAQWIRLPSSEGVWSSSNPDVLWVDNNERLALARHDGPVHLTYSLGGGIVANESNDVSDINSRPTYTLSMTIIPLTPICSDGRSTELVYVTLDEKGASTAVHGSIILPVVSSVSGDCSTPTTLQFNVKFCAPHRFAPDVNRNSDQFSTLSERAKQILSSAAPLQCAIRLITTSPQQNLPRTLVSSQIG
ncbi:unnamed protein product [Dicrocoelium dendriticum]|nr:unnamed protein product [Dicrocoelium dendriticum]